MPDRRFEYRQLKGVPIHDHVASVELEPAEGGTRIVWNESFNTRMPGLAGFLRWFMGRCAKGLAKRAGADAAAAGFVVASHTE